MRAALVVLALLSAAAPAAAQGVGPDNAIRQTLDWTGHEKIADWLSTAGVSAAVGLKCLQADDRVACVKHEAEIEGTVVALAETVKRLVHRTRPDGSDQLSFFSEHTAIACAASLGTKAWALCPAVAIGRVAADKHWATDVSAGALVGALLTWTW